MIIMVTAQSTASASQRDLLVVVPSGKPIVASSA
jgi:hypothetical protein